MGARVQGRTGVLYLLYLNAPPVLWIIARISISKSFPPAVATRSQISSSETCRTRRAEAESYNNNNNNDNNKSNNNYHCILYLLPQRVE